MGCSESVEGTKICRHCNRDLPRTKEFYNFHWSSSRNKTIMATYCRECKKKMSAEYHENFTRAKRSSAWSRIRHENEKLAEDGLQKCTQCQEVKPKNKEHFRWTPTDRYFVGKCLECDGNYRFRSSYRKRIAEALKNSKRDGSVEELLGCSVLEGRKHIESTWKPGMSWANHGMHGWHIDHIRPCASFNLSIKAEQMLCFNHKNLQALWAKENLSKGAKWDG